MKLFMAVMCLAFGVLIGIPAGHAISRSELKRQCIPQADEVLISTYQSEHGIQCTYIFKPYGYATRKREATR
jgi:hypothetical protein